MLGTVAVVALGGRLVARARLTLRVALRCIKRLLGRADTVLVGDSICQLAIQLQAERHPRRVLGHLAFKAAIHAYQARPTWQSSACCNGAPSGLGGGVETTGAAAATGVGTAAYAVAIGGTSILAGSI